MELLDFENVLPMFLVWPTRWFLDHLLVSIKLRVFIILGEAASRLALFVIAH